MADESPMARKISAYLEEGKVNKPKAKVIAHIYSDIMSLRDLGFSWVQVNERVNNNGGIFSIECETLKRTIARVKSKNSTKKATSVATAPGLSYDPIDKSKEINTEREGVKDFFKQADDKAMNHNSQANMDKFKDKYL